MAQKLGEVASGTILKLEESSALKEYRVVQQGLPSSGNYDASCDGTWIVRKDIYALIKWQKTTSNNGYAGSNANAFLNNESSGYLSAIPADIRNVIKTVKIPYRPGDYESDSSTVNSGANGLQCKAFALSLREVNLSIDKYAPSEGAPLTYYTQSGTSRIANWQNSPNMYGLRSPYLDKDDNKIDGLGWTINASGNKESVWGGSTFGVLPCIILPKDLFVTDDNVITLNQPPAAPGSIDVSGVVSGGEATITLTAAADPDGTVESYRYERQVDGGAWQQVAQVNTLTQTDHISEDWGTVAYRACAIDDLGAAGPYVTSETETINDGWTIISGPAEEMGSKPMPFDFDFSVSVSGVSSVDAITVSASLDGGQIYSGTPNTGTQITIPVKTHLLGADTHTIEVQASKDDYLPASKRYTFTVPAVAIPEGGVGALAQGPDGRAVYHTTLAQRCIGTGGVDIQAQVDALTARVKTLEG